MSENIYDNWPFLLTRFVGPKRAIKYQFNFIAEYASYDKPDLVRILEEIIQALKDN